MCGISIESRTEQYGRIVALRLASRTPISPALRNWLRGCPTLLNTKHTWLRSIAIAGEALTVTSQHRRNDVFLLIQSHPCQSQVHRSDTSLADRVPVAEPETLPTSAEASTPSGCGHIVVS